MAIGLVFGNLLSTITIITIIGTLSSIPTTPQIDPQKDKDKIATKELKLSELPINFGSTMFPIIAWIPPTKAKIMMNGVNSANWISENTAGNTVAINEPTAGI